MNESAATGAATGALMATAVAALDGRNTNRENRREIRRIWDDQDEIHARLESWLKSGDLERLKNNLVSDFLVGLCIPSSCPENENPAAFAGVPVILPRPSFGEEFAIGPSQYPPATNDYTPDGKLKQPSSALSGELVLSAFSLGHPIVRAMLIGLAANGQMPSAPQLAQTFRLFDALQEELRVQGGDPLTLAEFRGLWAGFFGRPGTSGGGGGSRGVVWTLDAAQAGTVQNTTTETQLFAVPLPADLLAVNQSARLSVGVFIPGSNSTDTFVMNVRQDSLAGTIIAAAGPRDPAASYDSAAMSLLITRRPDNASGRQYSVTVIGESSAAKVASFVNGSSLVVSGAWSVANAANIATATVGVLERL